MKIFQFKPARVILVWLLFFSCAPVDDGIYFDEILETKFEYSPIELEILDLINNYRDSKELPTLGKMNFISSVALSHTNYMVETGLVNHDNFAARNENLVVNANAKMVGENVAFAFNSAQGVVNAWINSDAHREIIENKNYTHFGISTEQNSDGRYFFTQIFIKK